MIDQATLRNIILNALIAQDVEPSDNNTAILGQLDSIGLVNFIMDVEDGLADIGVKIKIVTDKAFSRNSSPFLNIRTLEMYLQEIACQHL